MRPLKNHTLPTKILFWIVLVLSVNNLLNIDDQEVASLSGKNRIESFLELVVHTINSDHTLNDYPDEIEDSFQLSIVVHSYTMRVHDFKIETPLVQKINYTDLPRIYSYDLPLPKSPPPQGV